MKDVYKRQILNSKYKETLDKGIVFIFQINDLSGIKMCDEDIVVILSNLLKDVYKRQVIKCSQTHWHFIFMFCIYVC